MREAFIRDCYSHRAAHGGASGAPTASGSDGMRAVNRRPDRARRHRRVWHSSLHRRHEGDEPASPLPGASDSVRWGRPDPGATVQVCAVRPGAHPRALLASSPTGRPFSPGALPPGSYTLGVYHDPTGSSHSAGKRGSPSWQAARPVPASSSQGSSRGRSARSSVQQAHQPGAPSRYTPLEGQPAQGYARVPLGIQRRRGETVVSSTRCSNFVSVEPLERGAHRTRQARYREPSTRASRAYRSTRGACCSPSPSLRRSAGLVSPGDTELIGGGAAARQRQADAEQARQPDSQRLWRHRLCAVRWMESRER